MHTPSHPCLPLTLLLRWWELWAPPAPHQQWWGLFFSSRSMLSHYHGPEVRTNGSPPSMTWMDKGWRAKVNPSGISNILGVTPAMSPQVLNSCLSDTWHGWDKPPAPGEKGEREKGCACVCGGILSQAEHEELPASQCGVPTEKVPTATPIPSFCLSFLILAPLGHLT